MLIEHAGLKFRSPALTRESQCGTGSVTSVQYRRQTQEKVLGAYCPDYQAESASLESVREPF